MRRSRTDCCFGSRRPACGAVFPDRRKQLSIEQSLAALEGAAHGIEALLEELRRWSGNRRVEPGDFTGWNLGARFYPVLYILTRMGEAEDWGKLYAASQYGSGRDYDRPEVNALANYCFQTKETNLWIGDRSPQDCFWKVEEKTEPRCARRAVDSRRSRSLEAATNCLDFLEARRRLLAEEANRRFDELLHGDTAVLGGSVAEPTAEIAVPVVIWGRRVSGCWVAADSEEAQVEAINDWVAGCSLPRGAVGFELAGEGTGAQLAMLDVAWPEGLQPGLSTPVAVLLNEPPEVLSDASASGYRCFTTREAFRAYVSAEVLGMEARVAVAAV